MSTGNKKKLDESKLSANNELSDTEKYDPPADSLRILEALLFASEDILTSSRIKAILPDNPDARQIRKMVEKINVILQKERHPFEVVEIGGGYQFRTVSYYHPWVRQIFKEKAAKKLSIQSLECLAIIAYRQPLSKAEIEAIRGVISDGAMKTLLEKRLITITGRSDKPGRPLLYGTTHDFLKYFGLNKIEDLPRLEEFEAIAREKINELSLDELQDEQTQTSDEESSTIDTEIIDHSELSATETTVASASEQNTTDTSKSETSAETKKQPDPSSNDLEAATEIIPQNDVESVNDSTESVESAADETKETVIIAVDPEEKPDETSTPSSSQKKQPDNSTTNKTSDDTIEFDDGITEEEMTETAVQPRDLDTKIMLAQDSHNQPHQKVSQKTGDISDNSHKSEKEEILEVKNPPQEEKKE